MSMSVKLAAAKSRLGLTSAQLARRSGVPLSTVNKILSGHTRQPSPQALDRLCRALGVSLGWLMEDDIPSGQYLPAHCEGTGLRYLSSQEWDLVRDYSVLTVQGRAMMDALLELLLALSPLPLPTGRRRLLLSFQPVAQGLRGPLMDGFRFAPLDVALDSVTEARIQGAFDELAKGRTTLIIAHRLSTIRSAERILVIDNNRIAEEGTHEELMVRGGEYASLYNAQKSAAV